MVQIYLNFGIRIGINQNNQAMAGTGRPDPLQGSSEILDNRVRSCLISNELFYHISKEYSFNEIPTDFFIGSSHLSVSKHSASLQKSRDQNRLARKREIDRAYRQRKKAKTQELEVENQQLKTFEAEVGRLNAEIQGNKLLMKSELMKLLDQNLSSEAKILQLQRHNCSVTNKLETQSEKLDQLQDNLGFMQQLTEKKILQCFRIHCIQRIPVPGTGRLH
ncbi:hypothetical protein SLEP1_g26524 [Rubroshorea leprosula]|uniref:BZIP domain-containing protein n=1 Tax=Rubroshorea leprosula TaxID=152421 RepID=A0AAV5JWM3_9ROSI|nr:hypothetical protein SLEP1_g26524 [Rubroshorea leprosula]